MRGIVDHKGLLSILAVLVVAIIGLTAGIILIGNKSEWITEDDADKQGSDYVAENVIDFQTFDPEIQQKYLEILESTKTATEQLLQKGPEGVAESHKLFSENFQKLKQSGTNQISLLEFILVEKDILYQAGYKDDALKIMTDVGCDMFNSVLDRLTCIETVHELAKELNNIEVINEYEIKLNKLGEEEGILL